VTSFDNLLKIGILGILIVREAVSVSFMSVLLHK
jgi:hypothetical protein